MPDTIQLKKFRQLDRVAKQYERNVCSSLMETSKTLLCVREGVPKAACIIVPLSLFIPLL